MLGRMREGRGRKRREEREGKGGRRERECIGVIEAQKVTTTRTMSKGGEFTEALFGFMLGKVREGGEGEGGKRRKERKEEGGRRGRGREKEEGEKGEGGRRGRRKKTKPVSQRPNFPRSCQTPRVHGTPARESRVRKFPGFSVPGVSHDLQRIFRVRNIVINI
jgi:hypothetical protein